MNKTTFPVPGGILASGSTYAWQVRYKDGRGEWSSYSFPTAFTTLIPVTANGTGLLAHYGNSTNTPSLAVTTNATIDFTWERRARTAALPRQISLCFGKGLSCRSLRSGMIFSCSIVAAHDCG